MSEKSAFEQAIEKKVGEKIEDISAMSIDDRRKMNEQKHGGKRMRFTLNRSFIGRGSILRDRTISHDEVEDELRKSLRK